MIPLGEFQLGVSYENHTCYPSPGQVLFYPGGYSETEILFPYGGTGFASKLGQLAGNHFLTTINGNEQLRELGRLVLWEGAQDIKRRSLIRICEQRYNSALASAVSSIDKVLYI